MDTEKIKVGVKRFFANPNTVTFLLVIILIVGVYLVYSYLISRAIQPATIPYSLQEIYSKKEIKSDAIGSIKISGTFVTASGSGLIQNSNQIIGKYVAEGYQIPEKSFFYEEMLVDEKTAEKTVIADAPDNYTIFSLDVDFHSTYGCSIMPGNYIDIYVKVVDEDFILFDKFIESIKVTKVVDKNGDDVFQTYDDKGKKAKPAKIYFIVPISYYELLSKSLLIPATLELIPIPRNAGYSEKPKETTIYNDHITDYINNKTVEIDN